MQHTTTISEHTTPNGGERTILPAILSSRHVRATLSLLLLFALLYAIPSIPLVYRRALTTNIGPVLFLSLTVVACWRGSSRLDNRMAGTFWRTVGIAFAIWLSIRAVLPYVKADSPVASGIGADVMYAMHYLTLILAIEMRPHRARLRPISELERALHWPAIALFIGALLVYFVFIPLVRSPDHYATSIPSLYFFIALDLYVGARFLFLATGVPDQGWTIIYGAMSAAMFGFAMADIIELLQYDGRLDFDGGSIANMIWLLPYLGVVVAARAQRRIRTSIVRDPREGATSQQQIVVLALLLPMIHFTGYTLGFFEEETRSPRAITTLAALTILGILALIQQTLLQRKTRRLAAETEEATEALRERERTLQLMQERQQAIEAQRQSEINFSRVFNASPDPMAIVTVKGTRILEVNESFERFFETDRSRILGETLQDLPIMHPRDLQTLVASVSSTRGVHDFPAHVRTFASETRQCLLAAEAIEFGGEPSVVLAIRDVTEQIALEAFRDSLIAQLEAKNAELERFTYTVSHDLKSPLITIKGFLGFLAEDLDRGNRDRLEADLQRINDAAGRMQRLLDELLELSRVGRIINEPETFPLADLVSESLELVQGSLERSGTRIDVERVAEMPLVRGDRIRLLEVFQNLIENAIKFMGDQPAPRIRIDWESEEEWVRIRVSDNGIGIEPRFHEKVFGLFEQLYSGIEGTGIGLALVRRIIELHGGEIAVESEGSGKGSTFVFTLPFGSGQGGRIS